MRTYTELTKPELLALTSEEVEVYIQRELMSRGIVPPIEPPFISEPKVDIPKTTYYALTEGYGGVLAVFEKEEDALTVAAMPILSTSYDYNFGHEHQYVTEKRKLSVTPTEFSSKEDFERAKATHGQSVREWKQNKEEREKYQKDFKKTAAVREEVLTAVSEAGWEQRRAEQLVNQFHANVKLAEGDPNIAYNFLLKAVTQEELDAALIWYPDAFASVTREEEPSLDSGE
jgi:hypothetical protein